MIHGDLKTKAVSCFVLWFVSTLRPLGVDHYFFEEWGGGGGGENGQIPKNENVPRRKIAEKCFLLQILCLT